jgi:hypothetical protein
MEIREALEEIENLKKFFKTSLLFRNMGLVNVPDKNGEKSDEWEETDYDEECEKAKKGDSTGEETVKIPEHNRILTDWWTMTCKNYTYIDLKRVLKMEEVPWEREYGNKYYRDRLSYQGVNIFYNPKNLKNGSVMLEFSGKGCRTFEQYGSWRRLVNFSKRPGNNLTRTDVAYDDVEGKLDMWMIYFFVFLGWFVSTKKHFDDRLSTSGITVYIGSRNSDTMVRFYDKGAEMGLPPEVHWVRCEIVLRRGSARNFVDNPLVLGEKFAGVLNNFLCFVEPKTGKWDSNTRRWLTQKWWSEFIGGVEKISVYSRGEPNYTYERFRKTVVQYSGVCNSVRLCMGDDKFLDLMKLLEFRMKEHQKSVVNAYNHFKLREEKAESEPRERE